MTSNVVFKKIFFTSVRSHFLLVCYGFVYSLEDDIFPTNINTVILKTGLGLSGRSTSDVFS